MNKFEINFNKETFINCGACASVCDNWIMEGIEVRPKEIIISEEELKSNKEAEDICPVKAIKIEQQK